MYCINLESISDQILDFISLKLLLRRIPWIVTTILHSSAFFTYLGRVLIFDLQLYAPGRLIQTSVRLHTWVMSSHSLISEIIKYFYCIRILPSPAFQKFINLSNR